MGVPAIDSEGLFRGGPFRGAGFAVKIRKMRCVPEAFGYRGRGDASRAARAFHRPHRLRNWRTSNLSAPEDPPLRSTTAPSAALTTGCPNVLPAPSTKVALRVTGHR